MRALFGNKLFFQLEIASKLQRRSQLEEQKAELTSSNSSSEREVREAEKQLDPIQRKLSILKEQNAEVERAREKHAEKVRSDLESIKQNGNKVRELDADIFRYTVSYMEWFSPL